MDPRHPSSNEVVSPAGLGAIYRMPQSAAAGEIHDCWAQVGVNGDGTCPELAKIVHCRNCPVYSAAAAKLLNRRLPAEYRRQWTEHFSREKQPVVRDKRSVVIFRIGPQWLALPTHVFQEIVERRTIHSLPHRQQEVVLGLINVRGSLLICVSLGRLLGLEMEHSRDKSRMLYDRIVVTEWQGRPLAFPVNEVHGIHRHHPNETKEPPATTARSTTNFIRSLLPWENKVVACLDEELLFSTLNRSLA